MERVEHNPVDGIYPADDYIHALGGRKIPTTAIVVQTLDEEWLVEIEIIAVA